MNITSIIVYSNSLVTPLSDILLLIFVPISLPKTPQTIIPRMNSHEISEGILSDSMVFDKATA